MSMEYWPIALYGVDVSLFTLKYKYDVNNNDIVVFLMERMPLDDKCRNLNWSFAGPYDDKIYVGYHADYPWDMDAETKTLTKQDIQKEIQDFLNTYFRDVPTDYVEKNAEYIAEVGCG